MPPLALLKTLSDDFGSSVVYPNNLIFERMVRAPSGGGLMLVQMMAAYVASTEHGGASCSSAWECSLGGDCFHGIIRSSRSPPSLSPPLFDSLLPPNIILILFAVLSSGPRRLPLRCLVYWTQLRVAQLGQCPPHHHHFSLANQLADTALGIINHAIHPARRRCPAASSKQ